MAIVNGSPAGEILTGTADPDSITAGGGNDTVNAEAGADWIDAGADNDLVNAGAGNDTVLGNAGNDTIFGRNQNDPAMTGTGNDSIDGGIGNDELYGQDGNDTLLGGAGNDQIDGGPGIDLMDGGADDDRFLIRDTDAMGVDTIIGGAGTDGIVMIGSNAWSFNYTGAGAGIATSASGLAGIGFSEIETLQAGTGNDTVNATSATAAINVDASDGADAVTGSAFADTINAGSGTDTVTAGDGNDAVFAGFGNDTVYGNGGNDLLYGGTDRTSNQANTGDDLLDGGTGNDTMLGQSGNDTLIGGTGDDQLDGGPGSDSMDGGAGNDVFFIRDTDIDGADTVAGGADLDMLAFIRTDDWTVVYGPGQGAGFGISENLQTTVNFTGIDTLFAGSGDDLIRGNNAGSAIQVRGNLGDDTVIGSAYGDSIDSGEDNDSVLGMAGNDTVSAGAGNDYLGGGAGNDNLHGRTGNDTIDGGADNDLVVGWEDDDSLLGGEGNDAMFGDAASSGSTLTGNDHIDGGAGVDTAFGGGGNDTMLGGTGNDLLFGDAGHDRLDGGLDADILYGGAGNDIFVAGTGDRITDFNTGNTGAITDGDQTNNDFVDLSGYYNDANLALWNAAHPDQIYHSALGWMRADQADGTLNMLDGTHGLPSLTMTLQNGGAAVAGADLTYDNTNVPCFAAGTMIETDHGPRAVEDLAKGDLVLTRDNGLQPIRWAGQRALSAAELAANPRLQPIRIRAGAMGPGLPANDLLVSPQHRVLVRSKIARRMFGADEVLIAARQLCQIEGIDVADDVAQVTYHHIMFDRHEVVISNGAETESLFTGPEALKSVGPAARAEIFALFPELAEPDHEPAAARVLPSGRMGRKLAVRHVQNAVALVN